MSARSLQKHSSRFWNSLSPTAFSASTRNSINNYRAAAMGSPVSPIFANIYMEHLESITICTFPSLIKWCFRCVDDVHRPNRKVQINKFEEHLIPIDPHVKFTTELPGTDGLPFLDALTKPSPNSIESTVYRKPAPTDRYLDYSSHHPISAKLSVMRKPSSTELKKYVLHLHSLQKKWIPFKSSTRQPLSSTILSSWGH